MKKTIFEGVVNGKKFDNVEDYNAAMMQVMQTGCEIDASSSTKTVDVEEAPVELSEEERLKKVAEFIPWLFYGLDRESEELNESFLDNKDAFDVIANMSNDEIVSMVNEKLKEVIKLLPARERMLYMVDVVKILKYFEELNAERDKRRNAICQQMEVHKKRIEELQQDLDNAQSDINIIEKLATYYGAAASFVMKDKDKPQDKPTHNDSVKNLLKLCAEIFPDYKLS